MVKEKKIRKLLIDRDIKQIDLAKRIGVSKATISLTIKGERRKPAIQKKIAKILKVKRESIF